MFKILAAAAVLTVVGAAAAQAQDYGRPPYGSGLYGYDGGGCGGFTIVGARAGVTVLGFDVGVGGRLRFGAGECGGGYAPAPAYQAPTYQSQGYQGQGYQGQAYQGGGYAQPAYPASQPCGCGQSYGAVSYGYAPPQ